jgi:Ca-activated chloride channel family protein
MRLLFCSAVIAATPFVSSLSAEAQTTSPAQGVQSQTETTGARSLLQQAEAARSETRYEDALKLYDAAVDADPKLRPEAMFLKGNALHAAGRRQEARDVWTQIAGQRDAAFEAVARHNIGTSHYVDAFDAFQQQDAKRSREQLTAARRQLRDAVRLDPQLDQARANLELAGMLTKVIEQQPPEQEEQPGEDGEPDESDRDQQDQQGENRQSDSQEQSKSKSDSSSTPNQESNAGTQGGGADQEAMQPPNGDPSQQVQPAEDEPTPAPQQDKQQKNGGSSVEMTENSQENGDEPRKNITLTEEEAEILLRKVREREIARRQAIREAQRARQTLVERDW